MNELSNQSAFCPEDVGYQHLILLITILILIIIEWVNCEIHIKLSPEPIYALIIR